MLISFDSTITLLTESIHQAEQAVKKYSGQDMPLSKYGQLREIDQIGDIVKSTGAITDRLASLYTLPLPEEELAVIRKLSNRLKNALLALRSRLSAVAEYYQAELAEALGEKEKA